MVPGDADEDGDTEDEEEQQQEEPLDMLNGLCLHIQGYYSHFICPLTHTWLATSIFPPHFLSHCSHSSRAFSLQFTVCCIIFQVDAVLDPLPSLCVSFT